MPTLVLLITTLLAFAIPTGQAEIYKWQDEQGRTHFGDTAPSTRNQQAVEAVELRPINSYERVEISVIEANYADSPVLAAKRVVMYSTERCGYCKKARAYFEANKIAYTEHDIEKSQSARRAFDKMNGTGVPIILVGNKRMNGFSAARFARLYES